MTNGFYANRLASPIEMNCLLGLPKSIAESIRESYLPRLREHPIPNTTSNALVALLASYECVHVRIGLLEFAEHPTRQGDAYLVGSYESINQLVAVGNRCEVRFGDGQTMPLAQNADTLLAVLIEIATVQRDRLFGKEPGGEQMNHIIHLAGGAAYSGLITELLS